MHTLRPFSFAVFVLSFCVAAANAGNVAGKVSFKGSQPPRSFVPLNGDRTCSKLHGDAPVPSDGLVVNQNSTVKNVFIYVKNGLNGKKFPIPQTHAVLNQQGCMYSPHVLGMQAGQQLDILNSDQVIHNVHAMPHNSTPFNIAQTKKGKMDTKTFDRPEIMVKVVCNVHNWMASYIGVLDHPFFAVTDDKGNFEIKGLPPGEYDLEAWHEKLGTQTLHVKVGKADVKNSDFTFSGR